MNYSDRFIPRPLDYFSYANLSHPPVFSNENSMSAANRAYSQKIYEACTGSKAPPTSILPYRSREIKPVSFAESHNKLHQEPLPRPTIKRPTIVQEKLLDAQNACDDFYRTTMDVSDSDSLLVSLFDKLYIRSNDTINEIEAPSSEWPHSLVHCIKKTNTLLTGHTCGTINFIDLESGATVSSKKSAQGEQLISADSCDNNTLFTGTEQGAILQIDRRANKVPIIGQHKKSTAITTIAYSPVTGLVASGGNTAAIHIWDPRAPRKKVHSVLSHTGSICALQWLKNAPYTLVSGGRDTDKKIVVTDLSGFKPVTKAVHSVGSQITKILLGNTDSEILTCHGFPGNNCQLWQFESGKFLPVDTFCKTNHSVHNAIKGPDGKVYALVEDEIIRVFSNVFTPLKKSAPKRTLPLTIR